MQISSQSMKKFLIFTDGDVDLPSPYDKEVLVREKFEDVLKDGRIEPYRKSRGMNHALRNIRNIAQSKEAARLGVIYVGNTDMFNKCKSLVSSDCP